MSSKLALIDWLILMVYAGLVISIGWRVGKDERDANDYFLGNRRMPWWLVMISIYATALSALTFIGVPGVAFSSDFNYLQLGIGDLIGRCLIAYLLLTAYYRGKVVSIYELLGQRFGPRTHDMGTIFFLITRTLASAVRLTGCAIAFSVVFDVSLLTSIWIIAFIALGYTMIGGIKAVLWTDLVQFILFMGAAVIAIFVVVSALPHGWSDLTAIGLAHEKFKVIHFSLQPGDPDYWLNFSNPNSLIAGMLFGCFSTLAALGTDQDLVQRMLTCEKVKESQRALILTAIMNFPVTLIFLLVGTAMFCYYQSFPDPAVTNFIVNKQTDSIFPHFIKTVLEPGLRGFVISGMLAAGMSSVDSASNALASSAYIDIYKRYFKPHGNDQQAVIVSRWFTGLFIFILALLAYFFGNSESILWLGFKIVGYTYGAMLGIFLLAVLTKKRGHDMANSIIMISSVAFVIFLTAKDIGPLQIWREWLLTPLGTDMIAWPWAIIIGTFWTFGLGILFRSGNRQSSIA